MHIELKNGDTRGSFRAMDGTTLAGEMFYTWAGSDKFIIDHTEVESAFSGKGVGKLLVTEAVDYARKNNLKIMPLCPFAKSVFDKTPDFKDVLF